MARDASSRSAAAARPQSRARAPPCAPGCSPRPGAYRLFADADGATPIAELKRLEPALAGGADVVIGSRVLRDPAVVGVRASHRVAAGRVFNWLVRASACADVADSQCGFKALHRPRGRA